MPEQYIARAARDRSGSRRADDDVIKSIRIDVAGTAHRRPERIPLGGPVDSKPIGTIQRRKIDERGEGGRFAEDDVSGAVLTGRR